MGKTNEVLLLLEKIFVLEGYWVGTVSFLWGYDREANCDRENSFIPSYIEAALGAVNMFKREAHRDRESIHAWGANTRIREELERREWGEFD